MIIFKDRISGDEMFTDTYKYEEIDDALLMVVGKQVTMSGDDIQLDGANPSAEGGDEDCGGGAGGVSGVDVVLHMRLVETGFNSKKEYAACFKAYMKTLKEKLAEDDQQDAVEKLPKMNTPLMGLLKDFKNLRFFTGESCDAEGMIAIMDYKEIDGEEHPVVYFPKYGLAQEKV